MKSGENLNTSLLNDIPSSLPSISGHKSFIGFLYMEYTYNNPVVNIFAKLMTDAVNRGGEAEEKAEQKAAINQEILSKY